MQSIFSLSVNNESGCLLQIKVIAIIHYRQVMVIAFQILRTAIGPHPQQKPLSIILHAL